MNSSIDRLTAYLPKFENEPCTLKSENWWPTYADYVEEFFKLVEYEFEDRDYALNGIDALEEQLEDDDLIAQASVDQCRTLLTLILRGERFCDGYWRRIIESGRVQAILRRLSELCEEN